MTAPVRHRRPPSIATTLAAAALAGELAVAALATAPAASAHADDPPTADAPAAPASDPPRSDPAASDPEPPAPEPQEPVTPEVPPEAPPAELPEAPPTEVAVPAPPAAAPIPVRTGYATNLAPDPSGSRSPRHGAADEDRSAAEAPPRTGHDPSAATSTRTPTRTGTRGGRAPARRRHAAGAAADRRAHRSATPRTLPGAPPAGAAPTEHTVAPGEHLWGIAAASLAELTARPVASLRAEEIAPYWTRLCMLNAARLRSGKLDLIYPGEVVELPPL